MDQAVLNIIIQAKDGATTTIENVTGSVQKGGAAIKDTSASIADVGKKVSLALAGVAVGLTAFAKGATDFTVQYVKDSTALSRSIGVSVTDASRLVFAFSKLGLSVDDVSGSLGIFSKNIANATQDSEKNRAATEKLNSQIATTEAKLKATTAEIAKNGDKTGALGLQVQSLKADLSILHNQLETTGTAFDKIGVKTTDANGTQRDFNAILMDVVDRFKEMPNGIDKTALSMELFGRSGKDMIKVLNLGSQGIQDLEAQADKLGLTLTAQNIGAVQKYIASQKELKENTDAIKLAVGALTTPVMTAYNEKLAELVGKFQEANPQAKKLVANILAFGGPVAGAASGVLGFVANLDQALPALTGVGKALGTVFSNPYVLAILAVAAVIFIVVQRLGGLQATLQKLQPVIQYFQTLWQLMQDMFMQIQPVLVQLIGIMGGALKQIFDNIIDAVTRLWAALNPALIDTLKVLGILLAGAIVVAIGVVVAALLIVVQVINAVVYVITVLIGWLANLIAWLGNVVGAIINFVGAAIGWFSRLPGNVANIVNNIVDWFSGLPGRIGSAISGLAGTVSNAFTGAFEGAKNIAKSAVNWMIDKINSVISAVNNSAGKLPGVPNIPNIPRLATGTRNFAGGMAVVGEHGRELVSLPAGSQVIPNSRTERILSNDTPQPTVFNIVNNNSFKRDTDPIAFARMQAFELSRR